MVRPPVLHPPNERGPPPNKFCSFAGSQICIVYIHHYRIGVYRAKETMEAMDEDTRSQRLRRRPWRLQRRSQLQLQIRRVLGKQEARQVASTRCFLYTGTCSKGIQRHVDGDYYGPRLRRRTRWFGKIW